MENVAVLRVSYGGPELASHGVDARHLAGAMLTVADFIELAARTIFGRTFQIGVAVSEPFAEGNDDIGFVVRLRAAAGGESRLEQFVSVVAGEGGFASLTKWLCRRSVSRAEAVNADSSGDVHMRVHLDHEHFDALRGAWALYNDAGVNDAFSRLLSPLHIQGIRSASFAVGRSGDATNQHKTTFELGPTQASPP